MPLPITEHLIRIAVIAPPARFDVTTAPDVQLQLGQLLADGSRHLIVDLSGVTFCDSAAIAVLVRALKQARAQDGSVRLVWPKSTPARRIFSLTQFDQIFPMADTVDAAMRAFQGVR